MIQAYVLRPTNWEGEDEPRTITLKPEEEGSVNVDFLEKTIAVRPCPEKHGLSIKAFRGTGFSLKRRGYKDEDTEAVPRGVAVMLNGGDKIIVSGREYTFVVESVAAKKAKISKDDDDDDDGWGSLSSSLSLSGSSGSECSDDDNDNEGTTVLSEKEEAAHQKLREMYPKHDEKELFAIVKNTDTMEEAIEVIFDPKDAAQAQMPPPPQRQQQQHQQTAAKSAQPQRPQQGPTRPIKAAIADPRKEEIKRLVIAVPGVTEEQASEALDASGGNEDIAKDFLKDFLETAQQMGKAGGGGGRGGDGGDAALKQLQEVLPGTDVATLREALRLNGGDAAAAIDLVLSGAVVAQAQQQQPQPPPPQAQRQMMARPAEGRKDMRGMKIEVDVGRPWQSSGEMMGNYEDYIFNQVNFITDDSEMHHTAVCLQTMIENEQRRYNDSYGFYHSYSSAHLLYELNSLIATIVYDLDATGTTTYDLEFVFPPVPRILYKPFTVIKSIKELSDFCRRGGKNDGDPTYQAVGLSVSTSIFSTSSEAPPVQLFRVGYSANAVIFDNFMKSQLRECGFDVKKADKIITVINTTARKYNFPFVHGRTFGYGHGTGRATGHMLQIFINKDIVDEYAYPSECLGYRKGKATISETLGSGNTNGQARVYILPDLLQNQDFARLYYYCADMKFDAVRDDFVRDIKNQLAEIFTSKETRDMVKKNIRGKYLKH